jgi:plastocyanin
MKLLTVLFSSVLALSTARPTTLSLDQLKERVDEFFDHVNDYAVGGPALTQKTCGQVTQSFEPDATVTISGTVYKPDELEFLFCDYLPRYMTLDDVQVRVTNVDDIRGNVLGKLMLSGTWVETDNQFEDVELFWRLEAGDDKIRTFDLIPVNPAEFQEATLTPAMCGSRQIFQGIMDAKEGKGKDMGSFLDSEAILEAPNLYGFKRMGADEEDKSEWKYNEIDDFTDTILGTFNWTEAKLHEYKVIEATDTNYIAVASFHNLTTASGSNSLDDVQFWVFMEFEETEEEEDKQDENEDEDLILEDDDERSSKNTPSSSSSSPGRKSSSNLSPRKYQDNKNEDESPCADPPKLKSFRLLLSRPLQLRDLIDLQILAPDDDGSTRQPRSRAGQKEGEDDADQDEPDKEQSDVGKQFDAVVPGGKKDKDKADNEDAGEEFVIEAEKNYFSQPNLEILAGESVTFVNLGKNHRVIEVKSLKSDPDDKMENGFDSGEDEELSVTFDEPGTFYYLDDSNWEKGMRGVIRVIEPEGDGQKNQPTGAKPTDNKEEEDQQKPQGKDEKPKTDDSRQDQQQKNNRNKGPDDQEKDDNNKQKNEPNKDEDKQQKDSNKPNDDNKQQQEDKSDDDDDKKQQEKKPDNDDDDQAKKKAEEAKKKAEEEKKKAEEKKN